QGKRSLLIRSLSRLFGILTLTHDQIMQAELLRELLNDVRTGARTVDSAIERLRDLPFEDLGYARLDHHRALRKGFPEVVFCEGKRVELVVEIMQRLEHQ